jgi:hypothetical protein
MQVREECFSYETSSGSLRTAFEVLNLLSGLFLRIVSAGNERKSTRIVAPGNAQVEEVVKMPDSPLDRREGAAVGE